MPNTTQEEIGAQVATTVSNVIASQVPETVTNMGNSSSTEVLKNLLIKAISKSGNAIDKGIDLVYQQSPLHWVLRRYFVFCYWLLYYTSHVCSIQSELVKNIYFSETVVN